MAFLLRNKVSLPLIIPVGKQQNYLQ